MRAAAAVMGCSRSAVSRLCRGRGGVSPGALRDHLQRAADSRQEPRDAEWLGEMLFLYQVERGGPEAIAHWAGVMRYLADTDHRPPATTAPPSARPGNPLAPMSDHRDQLLARRVARHLRSMHAIQVMLGGHVRGLADAIAVQQAVGRAEHLPPVEHLQVIAALIAAAVPRDEHGLPLPYRVPDDLVELLPPLKSSGAT